MTSNRSYREAMPQQVVREEIVKGAGGQFPYYESPDSQDDLALSFCFDLSFSGWKDGSRLRQVEAGGNSYQAFRSLFFQASGCLLCIRRVLESDCRHPEALIISILNVK